ncbi:hypothetical protein GCM10027057_13460 [Marisediminicola antarctica]
MYADPPMMLATRLAGQPLLCGVAVAVGGGEVVVPPSAVQPANSRAVLTATVVAMVDSFISTSPVVRVTLAGGGTQLPRFRQCLSFFERVGVVGASHILSAMLSDMEGKIPMAARRHVTNKLRSAYRGE